MDYTFDFTRLLVSNFKACFLFYRDVLGFKASFGTENDTYADLSLGGVNIALFERQEMSQALSTTHLPTQVQAQDHICLIFGVEDVDAACEQLQAQGVRLTVGPTDHPDWGIRTAHLRDPDGNLIEINHSLHR